MKKLIGLDLDGTTLRNDKTMSQRTIETLVKCKQNGNIILFATARPPRDAYKYIPIVLKNNPIICYNGACIISSDKLNILYKKTIPKLDVETVIDVAQSYGYNNICLEIDDTLYSNFDTTYFFGEGTNNITNLKKLKYEQAYKIILCSKKGIKNDILELLPKTCKGIITDNGKLCQIINKEASKWTSMLNLAKKAGIKNNDIITFGDDYNDYDMIKNAGIGVAMGNGEKEIKKIADYITDTNLNDGVAKYLEKNLVLR